MDDAPAIELLDIDLASENGQALLRAMADHHGGGLIAASELLARAFFIRSSTMPGLRFVGGEADAARLWPDVGGSWTYSLAGTGETIEAALASCLGEAAERVSQIEQPGDIAATGAVGELPEPPLGSALRLITDLMSAQAGNPARTDWIAARTLAKGAATLLPADWVLRRQSHGPLQVPGAMLSTGTAAGRTLTDATVRAVLELVERDAVALWWRGGRQPRPIAIESPGMAEAVRLLSSLRQSSGRRITWLLDITSDLCIPTIAAVSTDGNGHATAVGFAARLTVEAAARAAILELGQLEIGLEIVAVKHRQRGEATLNDVDRRHLHRSRHLDPATCKLLSPLGPPQATVTMAQLDSVTELELLRARLTQAHLEGAVVDLTRPELAVPTARAVVPGLQPYPGDIVTGRLARTIAATGGGACHTNGIDLI